MRGLAAMLAPLLLLLIACSGGGDSDEPTAVPSPTASPTAAVEGQATPTPVAATATPPDPVGPVIVMLSGNPQLNLLAYDIGAGNVLLDIDLPTGNVVSYTGDAASGQVLVANDKTVSEVPLDGAAPRSLFTVTQEDYRIADVAVSPDGTQAAVAVQRWPRPDVTPTPDDGEFVVFLDIASGRELSRVTRPVAPPPGSPFEGFRGLFNWLSWRDDGSGVVVSGATFSEAPGSWATVFTDGRVVRHDLVYYANLAPNGRLATHGANSVECMAIAGFVVDVRDLDSGRDVVSLHADEGHTLTAWDWSPDSTQLLAAQAPVVDSQFGEGTCIDPDQRTWRVFDVATGESEAVSDLPALYQRWYAGLPLVTMTCADGTTASLAYTRWNEQYISCNEPPGSMNPLLVDGVQIAEGNQFQVIGIVEVQP